ncbi:MAG: Hfq-like protein [Terriglobia bacterium]
MNRKLIRPTLSEIQDQMGGQHGMPRKKPAPPEQTYAENFYYIKQMQARTPMVVVLETGENIKGVIEWYDKLCIKVHRSKEPNLLIMKSSIRYMYKQHEVKDENNRESRESREGNGNAAPDTEAAES